MQEVLLYVNQMIKRLKELIMLNMSSGRCCCAQEQDDVHAVQAQWAALLQGIRSRGEQRCCSVRAAAVVLTAAGDSAAATLYAGHATLC